MAGTSIEEICNQALALLGMDPIASIDDTETKAVRLKALWPIERDYLLSSYEWNFAILRAELEPSAIASVYGYLYSHPLPADCLRVLAAKTRHSSETEDDIDYRIEGLNLLANEDSVVIRYLARIEETGKYSPGFCAALAARLAARVSVSAHKDTSLSKLLFNLEEAEIQKARDVEIRGDWADRQQFRSSWIDARR